MKHRQADPVTAVLLFSFAVAICVVTSFFAPTSKAGSGTHVCYYGDVTVNLPAAFEGQNVQVIYYWLDARGQHFITAQNTGGAVSVSYVVHGYGLLEAQTTPLPNGTEAIGETEIAYIPTTDCHSAANAPPYIINAQ